MASSASASPFLSIVTPTRGNFSPYWFEQLLAIAGDVEFVLVYPPGEVNPPPTPDPRLQVMASPYRGEVLQRALGLLNARGKYVIALDDDDFLHPQVVRLARDYFEKFPESWVLRLARKNIDYLDEESITRPWDELPSIDQLKIARRREPDNAHLILQEVPIAPLENRFDCRIALFHWGRRRDHHGAHMENFNNRVWRSDLVKPALVDLLQTTRLHGPLVWMPLWNLDRLMGLYLQAYFFQPGAIIGHWVPGGEQIRYILRPSSAKEIRTMFPADSLLARRFPQYGYLWNLFFDEFYIALKVIISTWLRRLRGSP